MIYLDPPFNSKKVYNIIYKKEAQTKAFDDTWHWTPETQKTYEDIIHFSNNDKIINAIEAFHGMLGNNDLMAYLTMMTIRLIELHRVLKDTGSIYLHCDPTASHYLKIIMDNIFGVKNFRNEIIWCYSGREHPKLKHFPRKHDVLFFYIKNSNYLYNKLFEPHKKEYIKNYFKKDKDNRLYTTQPLRNGGRYVQYLDELNGVRINDWWNDIKPTWYRSSKEKTGYPTQKPLSLLKRIIKASSNPGDIVLDPFCGCATTMIASENLHRKWIGIDITALSIKLLKERMIKHWGNGYKEHHNFDVEGEPTTIEQVDELITERGRFRFQEWICVKIGGIPNTKKTGDKGEDGYYYFLDNNQTKKAIISVKSGHIFPSHIRELRGTVTKKKADAGLFITLKEPTKGMIQDSITDGYFYFGVDKIRYPKMQILTVEEILNGKKPNLPK